MIAPPTNARSVPYDSVGLDPREIDAVVEAHLAATGQPGAAVAIVTGDKQLLAKGYGLRDVARALPLGAHTLFPIASTSKAMTATLIATLVDDGLLDWDRPVRDYLPGTLFADPVAAAQATLRDLVTMRTGLPRHDWSWLGFPASRADMAGRLQWLEPSCGFRERFQYNNLTVVLAGHIAEQITGEDWSALMTQRIVTPLGMHDTHFARPELDDGTSCYHHDVAGTLIAADLLPTDDTGPSGGAIWSTIEDMARWAQFQLGDGTPLLRSGTLAALHAPELATGRDPGSPTPWAAYALGWFIDHYGGAPRISHSGYLHNVSSDVSVFPDHGFAIVSFLNLGRSVPARVLNEQLFDTVMDRPACTSLPQAIEQLARQRDLRVASAMHGPRIPDTNPSRPLEQHCGTYRHPGYGIAQVTRSGAGLQLRRGALDLTLTHWHLDSWIADYDARLSVYTPNPYTPANPLRFELDRWGTVAALVVALEPETAPIRFERIETGA